MPSDDTNRQQGGHRESPAAPTAPSQLDAGRAQFGGTGRRPVHVEPGHGDQRTYSPRGIAPDGTYIGRAGGYVGAAHDESDPGGGAQGEGTYGYAYGPGVGIAFERHPDDEARVMEPEILPEDRGPDPGDRFGAGRGSEWRGHAGQDPGQRDEELREMRGARPHVVVEYGAEHPGFRRRGLGEIIDGWRTKRGGAPGQAGEEPARERAEGEDGSF
jgi:hypothetical protein